jgi:DNA-binding PadR family transcriptional regulator
MAQKKTPRLDILILSTLYRRPMHGYELKLELRYRHVKWWAKVEHGHVYASLSRLEKNGLIKCIQEGQRGRKVYEVTDEGRRFLADTLLEMGHVVEPVYMDVDLFLAASYTLPRTEAVQVLRDRAAHLQSQIDGAQALQEKVKGKVPLAAILIMGHRARHLMAEKAFALQAALAIEENPHDGPFMGTLAIEEFLNDTRVEIEDA